MKKQLGQIWEYAQSVASKEDELPDPPDFSEIDTEKVQNTVDKLNEVLAKKKDIDKKVKAKLRRVTKEYPVNIAKYERQEAVLSERNRGDGPQLQQNRSGCHIYAAERGSYEEWST